MPEPLRVLRLITRLNVGGPSKHVTWLINGMDTSLFEQTLAAGEAIAGEDDLGQWVREQGVMVTTLPGLARAISPMKDLAVIARVLRLMLRIKPDILATHTSKAGFVGRLALLIYRPLATLTGRPRVKAVHTFHGHTFHSYFGPFMGRIFLGIEKFLARFATWRIVAISPRQLEEIRDEFKVGRADQFALVRLGIDLDCFSDTVPGRAKFRQKINASPDEIIIGAVGRVADVKNYGLFLKTAAMLKNDRPDLFDKTRFVLIGGGEPDAMEAIKGEAEALDLGPKLNILGNLSDPESFFPGLDILMLTSLNEGTPVSILEGGACNLPVVATCVGGVPDLLGPAQEESGQGFTLRERGITAPSRDAKALAAGLIRFLDDKESAAAKGRALKDYVESAHAKERLVADIEKLYQTGGV